MLRTTSPLWRAARLSAAGWVLAAIAGIAVGVAGYFHGHLFHEGYGHVAVVGPLFWLNALGSAVVVALLVLRRVLLFLAGGFLISVGSLVSILISHTSSFFGFAENDFDTRAIVIVVAQVVAAVGCLLIVALCRRQLLGQVER